MNNNANQKQDENCKNKTDIMLQYTIVSQHLDWKKHLLITD